ncbi:hypothetical protein PFISCL1PPCAC_12840, partial [Pristionchus fissidentatus]
RRRYGHDLWRELIGEVGRRAWGVLRIQTQRQIAQILVAVYTVDRRGNIAADARLTGHPRAIAATNVAEHGIVARGNLQIFAGRRLVICEAHLDFSREQRVPHGSWRSAERFEETTFVLGSLLWVAFKSQRSWQMRRVVATR